MAHKEKVLRNKQSNNSTRPTVLTCYNWLSNEIFIRSARGPDEFRLPWGYLIVKYNWKRTPQAELVPMKKVILRNNAKEFHSLRAKEIVLGRSYLVFKEALQGH